MYVYMQVVGVIVTAVIYMLTLTYTLAYYIKVFITAVESFIGPAPSLSSAARALNSILQ
jgi:hypothetical protein